MRYEFYGRIEAEQVIDNSSREVESIRERWNSVYGDVDSMIKRLEAMKKHRKGENLIVIMNQIKGSKLVKSFEKIDKEAVEKSNSVIINGITCKIINTVYDVENEIIKYYLDESFFHEKLSNETKLEAMDRAKKSFDNQIDNLIKLVKEKKTYDFGEYQKERGFFGKIFN